MAETAYPFVTGEGTEVGEDEWRAMAALWAPPGVIATGLLRDETEPSLKPIILTGGAGPTFGMAEGGAWVHGIRYANDADLTRVASENGSANPRIDRLVLELNTTAKTVTAKIIEGTASESPLPPAALDTATIRYLKIARATVAGSAGEYTNLVDERTYTEVRDYVAPSTGAGLGFQSGDRWWQNDTKRLLMHDGTALRDLAAILLGVGAVPAAHAPLDSGQVSSGGGWVTDRSAGVDVVGTPFVVPRSGKVDVRWASAILTSAPTNFGICGFRIGEGAALGGGDELVPPNDQVSLQHSGTTDSRMGRTKLVPGLPAGETCNVVLMFRTNTGSATFSGVEVSVDPKLL